MAQEEVRLKMTKSEGTVQGRSAFVATERKETRDCFNVGITGHLSSECTAPRRGRGRGYNKGSYRGGRGRGGHNNSGPSRAHVAATEQETASASQGELKNKGQVDNNFGNFAHAVYTKEGNSANASIFPHKSFSDWILDSGASKHVAGTLNELDDAPHVVAEIFS